MLHTSLSAKKSSPVNCRLFRAPCVSKKKGSLRQPAKKRYSPASVTRASRPIETGAPSTITCPPPPVPAAWIPSTRRNVAVSLPPSEAEKRTRYAISATAPPSVSILSSYRASRPKGSAVVSPGGFTLADGCTFMIRIDLPASPGLGKAYRSVRSRRASPWGNPKTGPEEWGDIDHLLLLWTVKPCLRDGAYGPWTGEREMIYVPPLLRSRFRVPPRGRPPG